jgi:hypothetical protein
MGSNQPQKNCNIIIKAFFRLYIVLLGTLRPLFAILLVSSMRVQFIPTFMGFSPPHCSIFAEENS